MLSIRLLPYEDLLGGGGGGAHTSIVRGASSSNRRTVFFVTASWFIKLHISELKRTFKLPKIQQVKNYTLSVSSNLQFPFLCDCFPSLVLQAVYKESAATKKTPFLILLYKSIYCMTDSAAWEATQMTCILLSVETSIVLDMGLQS